MPDGEEIIHMNETYLEVDGVTVFVRHNNLGAARPTILFIHGLGESGLSFQEVFNDQALAGTNLLVPDLAGYGRSSGAADLSLDAHVARLWKTLRAIEQVSGFTLDKLSVIGHSMGGDIATLLCDADSEKRIQKLVNIEGDLTEFDVFISNQAVRAQESGRFSTWFESEFKDELVLGTWGAKYGASCKRYFASLCFARPEAFLANAMELYRRNTSGDRESGNDIGRRHVALALPRVYCYGTRSIAPETVEFLHRHNLNSKAFAEAFHWPMIDRAAEFYAFVRDFISE